MSKFICESKKYQLAGPKEDVIGLPVKIFDLPDKIEVEGYELLRRSVFHVSLVAIGRIAEKNNITRPDFINEIFGDFCGFVKNKSIDFIRFSGQFRFVTQNERRTVIAMCEVANLAGFYELINKKYGLKVELPPTHVTIYTLQPDAGIFVLNNDDINNLTKTVVLPLTLK